MILSFHFNYSDNSSQSSVESFRCSDNCAVDMFIPESSDENNENDDENSEDSHLSHNYETDHMQIGINNDTYVPETDENDSDNNTKEKNNLLDQKSPQNLMIASTPDDSDDDSSSRMRISQNPNSLHIYVAESTDDTNDTSENSSSEDEFNKENLKSQQHSVLCNSQ